MIQKIADWYSDGGNIVLATIAYIFYWIWTVLQAIGMLVAYILIADFVTIGGCIALIIFTIPFVTIINFVILGFLKGHAQWLEQVSSAGHRSVSTAYRVNKALATKSQTQTGPTGVSTNSFKPEQQEKDKAAKLRQENTNLKEKEVVFTSKYFGKDDKGESVIVGSGSIGKIAKKNPNGSYDLEVMDEGKTKVIVEVQSFYFKF